MMKARPSGYFERVQTPIQTIRSAIAFRLEEESASGRLSLSAEALVETSRRMSVSLVWPSLAQVQEKDRGTV